MNRIIEIPFGTKDSELKGWEYTIPEGMEAVIENGKVIVREKVSEEERMWDKILNHFDWSFKGPYLTHEECDEIKAFLVKQKEQIPYIDFVIKPHKGDDDNPYDMSVSEAQEYASKRGFDIPWNDGDVFVDERYITQTVGNILRWADEHPKEQNTIPSRKTILGIWELGNLWEENPEERDGLTKLQYIQKYWFEKCDYIEEQKPVEAIEGSEDKRIRKFFTELATDACGGPGQEYYEELGLNYEKVISWLEKREEEKTLSTEETELNSLAFLEQMGYTCFPPGKGQKPTEWSEEDEANIDYLIDYFNSYGNIQHKPMPLSSARILYYWLYNLKSKFLHPQSK